MFGGKTKELQQVLEEREDEIKGLKETLKQRETELSSLRIQLDGFKRDREAVVSALTEAQETARRIVAQAEVRSTDMIREAEAKSQAICQQRDGIIAEAESRAQAIVEQAEACARESDERAAAKVSEAEEHANKFRDYVKTTADNIKRQAEEYAEFLSGAASSTVERKVELPENYKNPAELMKAIFAIQGRDLPEDEAKKPEAAKDEPAKPIAAEPAKPLGELNLIQDFDVLSDGEAKEQGADKLWTVDEVMQEGASQQSSVDDDLNAILGDVLKLD